RLRHAGEPCAGVGAVRAVGVLARARLALACRRGADLRQLALLVTRGPAGQQAHRGDAARRRQCRDPRSDRNLGHAPRRPRRARGCGHAGLSVGEGVRPGDVLFERRGAAGLVTLNRPHALNAVSLAMVRALTRQLADWESDPEVARVVVTSNDSRAFSAGGGLRALYDLGRARRDDELLGYFREEYALNARIKRYRKPYVALIDGIVMGGGVGISVHGSHRVAGDKFMFAMPEVGIGFFPDVGATFFLPRLPADLGTYCALTGERLDAADAVAAGVATHRVPSAQFPDLIEALCRASPLEASLAACARPAADGPVASRRQAIETLFKGERVEDILAALDAEGAAGGPDAAFASAAAALIRPKSPTRLKIALAPMRRGSALGFPPGLPPQFPGVSRVVPWPHFSHR